MSEKKETSLAKRFLVFAAKVSTFGKKFFTSLKETMNGDKASPDTELPAPEDR